MQNRIVNRQFLENYFNLINEYWINEYCCGKCRYCSEKEIFLYEFKRTGFNTFNLSVNNWKLIEDFNTSKILPIYENRFCNLL